MMSEKSIKWKHMNEEVEEDIMGEYQRYTLKNKKAAKRPHSDTETTDDETAEIPESERKCPTSVKKQKETINLLKEKLLEAMGGQFKTMKQGHDTLLNGISQVIGEIKEDSKVLKRNKEKIENLAAAFGKFLSQTITAQERKLTYLNEMQTAFKKQCECMESEDKSQASKLADELEKNIKKLTQKSIYETKLNCYKNLQEAIFQSFLKDL